MTERKTGLLIFSLYLAAITALLGSCGLAQALQETRAAEDLQFTTPELHTIADGTYTGSYTAGMTSATVEVTMAGGRISDLQLLEHRHGRGEKAEAIPGNILQEQSLEIEAVTGATISSNVILKATETALRVDQRNQ